MDASEVHEAEHFFDAKEADLGFGEPLDQKIEEFFFGFCLCCCQIRDEAAEDTGVFDELDDGLHVDFALFLIVVFKKRF